MAEQCPNLDVYWRKGPELAAAPGTLVRGMGAVPEDETKIPSRNSWIGPTIVAVVLILGGMLFFYLRSASKSEVSGSLAVDGASFKPLRCRSGKLGEDAPKDRPEFHGIDLLRASDRGPSVRVLEDPTAGMRVLLMKPGAEHRLVERAACKRFEVKLRKTGSLIMDVWGMEGSVDLDCPDVKGKVTFTSCYGGR